MNKLLWLLKRIYVPILFLLLWIPAISYYAHSTTYRRATLLAGSNSVLRSMGSGLNSVGDYFALSSRNRQLLERVEELENRLAEYSQSDDYDHLSDGTLSPYIYTSAKIISNSISKNENFFVIDKGSLDGVEANMAVINFDGTVAGYIVKPSERFAICMSILNTKFNMGGKIKGKEFFGSIVWDGVDPHHVTLVDISRYADVTKGDTIVSTYSFRFPPDVTIGTVEEFALTDNNTNYSIKVRLGDEVAKMRNVLVVKYIDSTELFNISNTDTTSTQ